ncbi:hypothetical protein AB0873_31785, partial [Micromonospora sp. NPDC047707]
MWQDRQRTRLTARSRRRAVGTGARYRLVFVDRLLATLVCLRHGVTHDVFRTGFDGDIETWEEHQRCPHRRSTTMSCVSV